MSSPCTVARGAIQDYKVSATTCRAALPQPAAGFEKQGGHDRAAFADQHVVGAAGRSGVHGLDADAGDRSGWRAAAGAAKRMRAPLAEDHEFGLHRHQLLEMRRLQRVEASHAPGQDGAVPGRDQVVFIGGGANEHPARLVAGDGVDSAAAVAVSGWNFMRG